jgi:D-tyrosyl-tRNA(Tyr) deacylase
MKAVIQRVTKASVSIDGTIVASIKKGMIILLGVEALDTEEDSHWLSKKISNLRIFDDLNGVIHCMKILLVN